MSTDKMIEDWAKNLGESSRTSADQTDSGDLKGWSASGPTNEDAARAIHAGLKAYTGRTRKWTYWGNVAKEALGIKRMGAKRWDEILAVGESLSLFTADRESFSFPVLVLTEPSKEVSEWDGGDFEEEDTEEEAPPKRRSKEKAWMRPAENAGPCGPKMLECGHWDWSSSQDHEKARTGGKCCAGWKSSVEWQKAGLTKAVPLSYRRTKEKGAGHGWPGLCCHPETHLYIGGIGNDCRYQKSKVRCSVHSKEAV